MGSPGQGFDNEHPQHTVYLDAFWIDKTEVTAAQFRKCVEAGACSAPVTGGLCTYGNGAKSNHPVDCIDSSEAEAFCEWAGRRLPSEAEWEKAARGTDGRIYPWGDQKPDATLANFNNNVGSTTPVGQYPAGASPYGALDMAGNAWEWVTDWYDIGYYALSPRENPPGPETGSAQVLRGGSSDAPVEFVRAAFRYWEAPDYRVNTLGFRCVRSP